MICKSLTISEQLKRDICSRLCEIFFKSSNITMACNHVIFLSFSVLETVFVEIVLNCSICEFFTLKSTFSSFDLQITSECLDYYFSSNMRCLCPFWSIFYYKCYISPDFHDCSLLTEYHVNDGFDLKIILWTSMYIIYPLYHIQKMLCVR